MRARWIVAIVGALALALFTLPMLDLGSGDSKPVADLKSPDASACDPKMKPANFDFTLKDMDGKDVKLADHKGKVILLDFWATWCGPCKYEIPGFVDLYTKYRDEGLMVLGVSVDDPVEKLKPFAEQYKMNYPVLIGLGRDDVQEAYGPIWGLPTTLLISRNGMICRRHMGMGTKEEFEREIKALL